MDVTVASNLPCPGPPGCFCRPVAQNTAPSKLSCAPSTQSLSLSWDPWVSLLICPPPSTGKVFPSQRGHPGGATAPQSSGTLRRSSSAVQEATLSQRHSQACTGRQSAALFTRASGKAVRVSLCLPQPPTRATLGMGCALVTPLLFHPRKPTLSGRVPSDLIASSGTESPAATATQEGTPRPPKDSQRSHVDALGPSSWAPRLSRRGLPTCVHERGHNAGHTKPPSPTSGTSSHAPFLSQESEGVTLSPSVS